MPQPTIGPLKPYNRIGKEERVNVLKALASPLSGYIGGNPKGGYWCQRLEAEWSEAFGVKHAIVCNSATSGLFASIRGTQAAAGEVIIPAYSMSATGAAAVVAGANVTVNDIEDYRFGLDPKRLADGPKFVDAVIVTNLFGHPAHLSKIKQWCDTHGCYMIEDNAQSPFAREGNTYAGCVGDLGVFSLNIHKHIQAGEGGIVVTNNDDLAASVRDVINHGELAGGMVGLNLRMTEMTAAVGCAQLAKAPKIIEERRDLAFSLSEIVRDFDWICAPHEEPGCKHVFYLWCALVQDGQRRRLVKPLAEAGVPIREGYAPLLSHVFDAYGDSPVAQRLEARELVCFEICAYDWTKGQLKKLRKLIEGVAREIDQDRRA